MRQQIDTTRFFARRSRREFLSIGSAAAIGAALPAGLIAQGSTGGSKEPLTATLTIDVGSSPGMMPLNYVGLSYEAAQLANPQFFSASNKELIGLVRELGTQGVLRIGGGTSEFTRYSAQKAEGPTPFETFGPDTSKTVKQGTVTTAFALENLRAFLDATGWTCLYGLNLGQGTKENAVAEAEAAHRILGPRLLALQIGNEPDSFRNRYRPASYGPQDFLREWMEFHDAIIQRVPRARFAGPDISNKLAFLTAFAEEARHHSDVILLTGHYYAMGPAGRPDATMENLLSANPPSTTMKWSAVPVVKDAMHTAALPFRLSEANSCWNGGQAGVSDAFGSALWCADTMLHFASLGFCGINLHGGGNGVYSPIVGSQTAGFARRPEFFGMQFANRFAGATMERTSIACESDRVTAYAAGMGSRVDRIAIINKADGPLVVAMPEEFAARRRWSVLRLTAPSVESTTEVRLVAGDVVPGTQKHMDVAPYSALLLSR